MECPKYAKPVGACTLALLLLPRLGLQQQQRPNARHGDRGGWTLSWQLEEERRRRTLGGFS
eukprot:scaffold118539_cov31-Tisochrysis_lutea.AAC.7